MAAPISWYIPVHKRKALTLIEIALFGMLGALTFGAKVAMSALYNIEPVSLMVMLFAVVFGWKCVYPISLYVVMEILYYGIQLWNLYYLYIWFILALGAIAMRRLKHPIWWALLSGAFGMAFGFLCMPVNWLFTGSFIGAIGWWMAGLFPADTLHAVGNFTVALVLFVPLRKLMERLYAQIRR